MLAAKMQMTPANVAAMCHAEAAAWIDTLMESLGIKKSDEGTIVSQRRKAQPGKRGDDEN